MRSEMRTPLLRIVGYLMRKLMRLIYCFIEFLEFLNKKIHAGAVDFNQWNDEFMNFE